MSGVSWATVSTSQERAMQRGERELEVRGKVEEMLASMLVTSSSKAEVPCILVGLSGGVGDR